MPCQDLEWLTFQFFIVFVVHMSVGVAALAEEAALMIVCHMLPKLILAIKPLVTKSAQVGISGSTASVKQACSRLLCAAPTSNNRNSAAYLLTCNDSDQ